MEGTTGLLLPVFIILVLTAILALGCKLEVEEEKGENRMSLDFESFVGDGEVVEQEFSESMPTDNETDMVISHSHGHIIVKGWDRDEVKLEGKKTVSARDQETARMYAQQMRVEIESQDGRIIVKTIRPKREGSWRIRHIALSYELYAPKRLSVALKAEHGNVHVEGFAGKLDMGVSHGNSEIIQIGEDVTLDHEHGEVRISQVGGDLTVCKQHGNLRIESLDGELRLDHEHGRVDVAAVGKGANIDKEHGDLSVVDVGGMLEINHQHGKVHLRQVKGGVRIRKQHGNVDIETVSGNVSAHCDHASLRVIDIEGDVYSRGSHGNAHVENVSGSADVSRSHGKVHFHNVKDVVSSR